MKNPFRLRLFPRKQLDIGWLDLAQATLRCIFPGDREAQEAALETILPSPYPFVSAFCVRAGFELCLKVLDFPAGSEIVMSALTIQEMADIPKHHGLVPIPVDINPDTLAPEPSAIEALITERTKAIVIAHLFGTRIPMEPIIAIAKKHGLFVFEDCAQAFTGPDYTGHPETDAAMFSFGSIKTITALGGALIRVKDKELARSMKSLQQKYPIQSRKEYFSIILTHVILKIFTTPVLFGLFYRACGLLGADFERVITAVRGADPVDLFREIRKQSSFPLLALLARRLCTFDAARLAERTRVGDEFAKSLPRGVAYAGSRAALHSYWVFPIYAGSRERLASALRKRGFDSTSAGSALSVIEPPADRGDLEPVMIRDAYRKLLYLPVYAAIPERQRMRMSKAIGEIMAERAHLHLRDARRVYAAVASTVEVPRSVADIGNVLRQAQRENRSVCLMGTSHNLGGHAFAQDAVVLDMTQFARVRALDVAGRRITVESGITWDQVQEAINPAGLAVKCMQSDNNFTVGGSLAANAHGRDMRFSMLIESVVAFRMMLADGSVARVSREENPELFGLAIGGYGLFGIILDVELQLVENCIYEQTSFVLPMSALVNYVQTRILTDPSAEFFIGRPSISPRAFLKDTIVTVWSRTSRPHNGILRLDHERNVARDRFLFGLSRKYAWGKELRWYAEKHLSVRSENKRLVSRNNAMRPPVSAIKMFEYNSPRDTDVIQEYFVAVARFTEFFDGMRAILAEERTNLLGITIRYVKANDECVLSYAPREDALAAVLYYNEEVSVEGRAKTDVLLERLTSLTLEHGGTFYLTYVRDIEPETLRRVYPNIDVFFEKKQFFDPQNLLTSRFFAAHGRSFAQVRAASATKTHGLS